MISSLLPVTLPHCHTLGNEQDCPPVVLSKLGHLRSVLDCRLLSVGQWNAQGPASAFKFPRQCCGVIPKTRKGTSFALIDERNPQSDQPTSPATKKQRFHFTTISEAKVMRNFLGFLVIVAIVVLAVGYYLDWFKFSSSGSGNTSNFNMQVDKDKMKADTEKAKVKIQESTQDLKEKIKPGTEPAKDKTN